MRPHLRDQEDAEFALAELGIPPRQIAAVV
jgi:hypothetical protein